MSADNYLLVRKRPDGRFGISHRFASAYYTDEGHTVESLQESFDLCGEHWVADESWLCPPEKDIEIHDDATDAILAAHRLHCKFAVVEYGVQIGEGVL